jgi:hypothetical protein
MNGKERERMCRGRSEEVKEEGKRGRKEREGRKRTKKSRKGRREEVGIWE